jgi:hypothetical protein
MKAAFLKRGKAGKIDFLPFLHGKKHSLRCAAGCLIYFLPQQFLYFLPLPHGQGSLRPILIFFEDASFLMTVLSVLNSRALAAGFKSKYKKS